MLQSFLISIDVQAFHPTHPLVATCGVRVVSYMLIPYVLIIL